MPPENPDTKETKKSQREAQIAELELEKNGIDFKGTSYSLGDAKWDELIASLKQQIADKK